MFDADINVGGRNVGKGNQPRRGTYASVYYRGGYRGNRSCVFGPSVGRSYLRRPDPAEWQMLVLGKALIPE
jgi:hypothetical protein